MLCNCIYFVLKEMVNMNIIEICLDKIYKKIMDVLINKKEDIYRYELMKFFEFKWKCMNVLIVVR